MDGGAVKADERIMALILRISNRIERRLDEVLEPVDLTLAKYGALTKLAQAAEPLSLGELAAQLVSVRSNISQLVDRLEADGLVRRAEDPRDRRCVRADLTPLGRERQEAGAAVVQGVREEVAALFAGVDFEILERALVALGGAPVS